MTMMMTNHVGIVISSGYLPVQSPTGRECPGDVARKPLGHKYFWILGRMAQQAPWRTFDPLAADFAAMKEKR